MRFFNRSRWLTFSFLIAIFLLSWYSSWQDNCPVAPAIIGQQLTLKNFSESYIASGWTTSSSLTRTLKKNSSPLKTVAGERFSHTFTTPGTYSLTVTSQSRRCPSQTTITVVVYQDLYLFLGDSDQYFSPVLEKNIANNMVWFQRISASNLQNLWQSVRDISHLLAATKATFVHTEQYSTIFEGLNQIERVHSGSLLQKKPLFLVSDIDKWLLKKIMASFLKQHGINEFYIISSQEFKSILFWLSIGQNVFNNPDVPLYQVSFWSRWAFYSVSWIIDYLVYHWFPLNSIKILLMICLLLVIITVIKQVIGLSSFAVYQPIIFVLICYLAGIDVWLFFMTAAFLSTLLISFISTKISFLYSSKISLTIILYFLLTFWLLGLSRKLGIFSDFTVFSHPLVLVAYLYILTIAHKLFLNKIIFSPRKTFFSAAHFLIFSFILLFILQSNKLGNFLLIYPEIILLFLFILILVWKYTGLQITEVIRFMPLIKRQLKKISKP